MTVTPAGMFSYPLFGLGELIADCSAFQSWVSADDKGAAWSNVHYIANDDSDLTGAEALATRPFAIVGFSEETEARRETEPPTYDHSGTLELIFEAEVSGDTESDIFLNFTNAVGAIMAEIETKTGRGGHLLVTKYSLFFGPARPSSKARTNGELDIIAMGFLVEWAEL